MVRGRAGPLGPRQGGILRAIRAAALRVAVAVVLLTGPGLAPVRAAETGAIGTEANAPPVVTRLAHRLAGDRLRLVLELTAEPAFAAFTLDQPRRLVVDLGRSVWAAPLPEEDAIPYIEGVRQGRAGPDRARVVFDLTAPLGIERAFTEPPVGPEPSRLVIDLAPESAEAFQRRAGWPDGAREGPPGPPAARGRPGTVVIALDPGHGGIDPGATAEGLVEKDLVLAFARRLAAEIDRTPGLSAFLTREDDRFLGLAERIALARQGGAHALVSLHADALEAGSASGVAVYTLSPEGSDAASRRLARRANLADALGGGAVAGADAEVAGVLIDLARRGVQAESEKLAAAVLQAMGARVPLLASLPHRRAGFRVLSAPDLPAVLVELGFLDSAEDRTRLISPAWQDDAAEGLAAGLAAWVAAASPGFVRLRE